MLHKSIFWLSFVTCSTELLAFLRSVRQLLFTANIPNLPILVTLMMEALRSSEKSGATRRKIPGDDILHSHSRGNLKSYMTLTGWAL
jgi:hypothetical protein